METFRRYWRSPLLLLAGWAILLMGLAALLDAAAAQAACIDDSGPLQLFSSCGSGLLTDWFLVVVFAYALGLTYLTLRRWINRPTDDDPAD